MKKLRGFNQLPICLYLCICFIFLQEIKLLANVDADKDTLLIGIMQDKKGVAFKYKPLIDYFASKGIKIKFIGYTSYRHAAEKFKSGKIDGMFAGSGVAAAMIIKGLAYPLVRPLDKAGWSTYWAVILVPKTNKDFKLTPQYLKDKKIICCALASSGEFYCKSFLGKNQKLLIAGNHGNAISALSRNVADVAIVKNRVWDQVKSKYPNLKKVAEDDGQNPNGTFIISTKVPQKKAEKIKKIFLGINEDQSPEAKKVKEALHILGYIITTKKDFKHTIPLVKKAGVDTNFKF